MVDFTRQNMFTSFSYSSFMDVFPTFVPKDSSTSTTSSSLAQHDAKKAESDLERHVSDIIGTSDRLEQDDMETGVDEQEWVSSSY